MIEPFERALAELATIAARAEAHGSARALHKTARIRDEIREAAHRLAEMPDDLQRMLAYRLQHRNGGYLHLELTAPDWEALPAAYARGERFHDQPEPYKSLL